MFYSRFLLPMHFFLYPQNDHKSTDVYWAVNCRVSSNILVLLLKQQTKTFKLLVQRTVKNSCRFADLHTKSFKMKVNGWEISLSIGRALALVHFLYLITGLVRRASLASIINFFSLFSTLFSFHCNLLLLRGGESLYSTLLLANVYLSIM